MVGFVQSISGACVSKCTTHLFFCRSGDIRRHY
ncbi:hypothetical protein ACJIZ3_003630 [Penstemon smallii]|uniref:Uncharacterized protein n=1 Tax=Penstemon smallii TaxID=265156 RepID=A0ABD3U9R6_9LAMI